MVHFFEIGVCIHYIFINVDNYAQEKLINKKIIPLLIYCYISLQFSSYLNEIVDLGSKLFPKYGHKS